VGPDVTIVFCVAAGPRIGFGYLTRCQTLARALRVKPVVMIRGGPEAIRAAQRAGCRVITARQLWKLPPSVIVIDEPSGRHTRAIAERARLRGHRVMPITGLALMPRPRLAQRIRKLAKAV
jgi:hypothetical protein